MEAKLEWIDALAGRVEGAFESFTALFDAPVAHLEYRSTSDRWSALEVGEHVALANRFLLILVSKLADKCRWRGGVAAEKGKP